MTCAVSAAVREGAEAVICASTGNTAASAAAYAARAGLTGAVIVPEGSIATGKLAQALMHGARVVALRGNFDEALALVRELCAQAPDRARQLRQPVPPRGAEDRGVRGRRGPRRRARRALHPGRQRRQRHGVVARLRGGGTVAPRAVRLPGRGRRAARRGPPDREARDDRQRDPDRQPGALGGGDGGDDRVARHDPRGDRRRDPRRLAPARRRARASSASRPAPRRWPGCCATAPTAPSRVVCVLTGHGLKDPQTALDHAGAVVPCEPRARRGRAGRARLA